MSLGQRWARLGTCPWNSGNGHWGISTHLDETVRLAKVCWEWLIQPRDRSLRGPPRSIPGATEPLVTHTMFLFQLSVLVCPWNVYLLLAIAIFPCASLEQIDCMFPNVWICMRYSYGSLCATGISFHLMLTMCPWQNHWLICSNCVSQSLCLFMLPCSQSVLGRVPAGFFFNRICASSDFILNSQSHHRILFSAILAFFIVT